MKYLKIKPSENFNLRHDIKSFEIEYLSVFLKKKEIELHLLVNDYRADTEINNLKKMLHNHFSDDIKIIIKIQINLENIQGKEIEFIEFIIRNYKSETVGSEILLSAFKLESIKEKEIVISVPEDRIKQIIDYDLAKDLESKIFEIMERDYKIQVVAGEFLEVKEKIQKIEDKTIQEIRKAEMNYVSPQNQPKPVNVYNSNRRKIDQTESKPFSILNSLHSGESVSLEGHVFEIDIRETRNGNILCNFMITDYTDSISCTIFLKNINEQKFGKGDWVKVTGFYEPNNYNGGEYYIRVQKVDKIEKQIPKRVDNAPKKRIELHAHTNMSEMSSNISAQNLAKKAKEFGHNAVAVTDFGVVHSYPFAFKESIDNFKIIFGLEAYMVDDEQEMITNPKDINIEDETYVIFDIETTGFNPFEDKIIEIGAIKMEGTKIIGEFSEFINPEILIPEKITELTKITDDMVKDADKIEIVLPKFLEFCKGTTVVAHNAKFDVGFITQKAKSLNLEFSESVIDTLYWAKILLGKEIKRFSLDYLTGYYNITLENHHRAIDDAKATAEVFQKLLNNILSRKVLKLPEINTEIQMNIQNADTLNTMILVKNQAGLRTLYELVSKSHIDYFGNRKPRIPKTLLNENRENFLLASSASNIFGNRGELIELYFRGIDSEEIEEKARFYDYIELHPMSSYTDSLAGDISMEKIKEMHNYFIKLGEKLDKPVVATGDVQYLEERENINRSVLVFGGGLDRNSYKYNKKLYFKTTDEMLQEFDYLDEEIAEKIVIDNTHLINDMIEVVRPVPKGFYPPKIEGAEEEVREMSYKKLYELYGENIPEFLKERVEKELNSIINNGFAVLYLIAQKLVKKSLDNGYLVGSRGSVGSSIVAYLMGITEVNALYPHYRCEKCKISEFSDKEGSGVDLPDKNCPQCGEKYIKDGHAIPFEVFMGFNGDKVPDIDLNFSGEYQGEIHKYTEELFGADNVFRAGTIGTLAEKNAFGYVKKYFEEAKKSEETEEEILIRSAEITRIAKGCEGARKTTGQHPGGMIVVPKDKSIYDFCPVQRPANDLTSHAKTTHFDYHVMDEQLVKLDILGHDDPTTLRILQDLTGVDIYTIPLDDKKVMSLFSGTEALGVTTEQIGSPTGTSGIPEFGTGFVKQMLVDTKPKTFAELVRISGLSHGTDVWLNNAQEYVRQGIATLSEVITVRDDIMNYLIDNGLEKGVAFSIMEFVRKGQPTKNPEKWEEYSKIMKEHKVQDWYIESCKKIKYMFPKGHAAAYVMMAVRIAYFKVYYPIEFYTAFLNRKVDDFKYTTMFKKVEELKNAKQEMERKGSLNAKEKQELFLYEILIEMHYRGIELEKVDIYNSEARLFKIENGKIRMPLIAMDGLGESVALNIIEERDKEEFLSQEDLAKRTKLNKTVMELMRQNKCFPKDLSETSQRTLF